MAWTTPRTWVASEFVTASIMNTHVRDNLTALSDRIQVVRKVTDETVTSSTVLQNDDELKFTAVAGQTYVGYVALIPGSGSSAVDLKVGWSFPAGTMAFGIAGQDTAATTNISSAVINGNSSATSATTSFSVGVPAGNSAPTVNFSFLCTTGGTVNLMWAQDTSSATGMTVKSGSSLLAVRVAT